MARTLTFARALNEALDIALGSDPDVLVLGEDVAGGGGRADQGIEEAWGGIVGVTRGLYKKYGAERVRDTPISEMGFLGAAVGAAATGLRPVVELMFMDFIGVCLDPLLNQAAKLRYMFGGRARVPLTVRTLVGGGLRAAAQHSQTLYGFTTSIPGLKTVVPSSPADAKGLLLAAIRDDDPVVFCEPKALLNVQGEVPAGDYEVPLGRARVVRPGNDLSLVAIGAMVRVAEAAAAALEREGVAAEVLDVRSLQPLDAGAILATLEKTGRMVVIDEAPPRCSIATDIAALCVDEGFDFLNAPIKRVTAPHAPSPFSPVLEDAYLPSPERVLAAAHEVLA
jgi:pyruvate dehydrogenase E1 component beta subunit